MRPRESLMEIHNLQYRRQNDGNADKTIASYGRESLLQHTLWEDAVDPGVGFMMRDLGVRFRNERSGSRVSCRGSGSQIHDDNAVRSGGRIS
ncbi:hypothetical protein ACJ73_09930 [Blastomyces percursus]|uniref:Uncharacterized protein n=1 Tax=Blastomyces percursus TaxID=1658174 RepID=A0A1J9NZY9_9EURO|nr:hypothetical protein ACJ73_09930 [Blastomyces percursus]